jgi:MFS family permease
MPQSLLMQPPAMAGRLALHRTLLIGLIAFLTLVDLFAAQAILPSLAAHYGVSPAEMGTAVNATTLGMAVAALGVALFGRRVPRRRGILASLVLLAPTDRPAIGRAGSGQLCRAACHAGVVHGNGLHPDPRAPWRALRHGALRQRLRRLCYRQRGE